MALVTSALTIPPAASINAAAAPRRLAAAAWRSVVPLVYGEERITGLLLNVLAHATDARLVLVQVLWCHACDSVNDVLLNDEALPAGTGTTHYDGAQLAVDATLAAAFAAQGITYTDTLNGYAYSVLALPVAAFTGQLNVSARIKGRKLYDPRLDSTQPGGSGSHRLATPGTWAWSSCPALALADWLYSPTYGAGEPVDWVSVQAAANANDALIGSPSEVRRLIGTAFAQQVRVQEMADALRAYASCWLVPTVGGIKLLPDAHGAAAASYAHASGQIAALDALTKRDLGDTPTAVEVIYTDRSATPWRDASVTVNLPGAGSTRPWRLSTIRLPGIQRYSQAKREATERLNKFTLNDLSCAIEVFDVGIRHELGDIVEITHPIGPASKPMRVVDAPEMVAPGRWRLALVEHDPAAYSTAVETEPTYADTGRVIGWRAQGGRNLLDASTWVLKSYGSQPGFAQNGQSAENLIDTIQAPDGSYSPGWIMYAGGFSGGAATYGDADGGFDTDPVPIDATKAYRLSAWFCSHGSATAGSLYLGCGANSVQPVAGGPPVGNPYFAIRNIPDHTSGNWYLYVGYVFGEDYDSGQANRSGIYDAVTGAKVQNGTDFKWVAGQPTARLRAYQFYANVAANRSDLWGPAIELCDGSEPSIAQLLATAAVSARNPITSANAATYVGTEAIDDSRLSSLSVDKLTAGSVAVSAYLQSTGFVTGSSGWRIKGDGSAEFAAAMIRDQLTAAQINVSSLSSLSANLGTITAGTITLDSSGFIRAGQTAYDTGAGFHLGYAGGAYKFSVGDASRALLWDGSTLTVRGDVIATSNIQLRAVSEHKWAAVSTTLTISGGGGYPSFPSGIGTQKASGVVTVISSSSPPVAPKDAVYSAIFVGTVTAALKYSLPASGTGWDLYVSYRLRVKDSDGSYQYGPTMKQRAPLYITSSDEYTAQITAVRSETANKALVELAIEFLDASILRRAYETATFGTLEALDTVSVVGNGSILLNLV